MSWLIFYLLGVVVVLTMMSKPLYKELKEGDKPRVEIGPLLRLLSFVILSWAFVAYVAIDESWND